MQRIGTALGMTDTQPQTAGRPEWEPPADLTELYARVQSWAGDRAVEGEDADADACTWCGDAAYVIRRKAGASILEDEGRLRACGRCIARRRQISFERIGVKAVLTFADWRDEPAMRQARKACDELLGGKRWAILLSAGTGRGKTHLAIATLYQFVHAGRGNALFVTAPEMFERMRDAYDPGATYTLNALVDLYETRDLLVIDDLGSEYHRPSADGAVDWIDEKLFRIVDTRYQRKLRTFITTNVRPGSAKIPARIRSRLAGCEIDVPGGDDQRRRAEQESRP